MATVNTTYIDEYRALFVDSHNIYTSADLTNADANEKKYVKGDVVTIKIGEGDTRLAVIMQDITIAARQTKKVEILFSGFVPKNLYSTISGAEINNLAKVGILLKEDK